MLRKLVLVVSCFPSIAFLGGCSVSSSRMAAPSTQAGISGSVHGGQQPVVGATMQLYTVGTTGDGSGATPLLSGVPDTAQLSCEEVFAPVVIVEAYESFPEVLATVNHSKYGLQAAIFTGEWKKMTQAWNELEVGAVLVDESSAWRADHLPYGGVKNSGVGREGVRSAILEMTEARLLILPAES